MKNNIFGLSLCAIALSGLVTVSCQTKTETVVADVPTITIQAVITLPAEGGTYSLPCTVNNPVAGGEVSCLGDATWITDYTYNESSSCVDYTVAENADEDIRTGNIIVTYSYTDSNGRAAYTQERVGVVQYGTAPPALNVDPSAVTATAEGGAYSFGYSIENRVSGGEFSCVCDADWISDLDYSTYGTVSFTVAANKEEALRTATVKALYSFDECTIEKDVTVIQDHSISGFYGDVSDLFGTYTATGYAYYSSGVAAYKTWTAKIYETYEPGYDVLIDGLVPDAAGMYPNDPSFIAQAYLNSNGQLVVPAQLTGYIDLGTYCYIGWYPCVKYEEGSGWYPDEDITDLTFTYDSLTETWTSDYGVFLTLFSTGSATSSYIFGFYDVVNPGFTLKKTGNFTDSAETTTSADKKNIDVMPIHHELFNLK